MEDAKGQLSESAAQVYERFFVPALFGEWAPRVVEAVQSGASGSLLDVACGTGVVAREAARRLPPGAVVGLDRNPGMLAVARSLAPAIDWREGVAEELPFEAGRFTAVTSQFGLMFFDDRVRALGEMKRVLAPGGRLAVAVWASLDDTPGYAAVVALLARLFGDAVADELRAPFCLGDRDVLGALLAEAGIDARVQTVVGSARFPSIADWVRTDIRGWTLADVLDDDQYARLAAEAETALAPFAIDGGRVEFASPAHIVTAVGA